MDDLKIGDRDWYQGIKDIREREHFGIFAAQAEMLKDPKWRRWIALRVRANPKCYRQAKHHVEDHGSDSLFELEGRRVIFPDSE